MNYLDQRNLSGKTALITGGAGFLGKEFCHGFIQSGANVIIVDQDMKAIEEAIEELAPGDEQKVLGIECDVASAESVTELLDQVEAAGLIVDTLVNNAASKSSSLERFFDSFEDYQLETWKEVMSVNIDGMFLVAQAVGKHMLVHKVKGSIIQTSSIYGHVAPNQSIYEGSHYLGMKINTPAVYSASKAAVVGLSNYLATYWAEKGIRVNTLTPGGIESGQNETFIKNYSNRVPLGRMGQKEELVGTVLFLASEASSYTTGQNFIVDGGLSTW